MWEWLKYRGRARLILGIAHVRIWSRRQELLDRKVNITLLLLCSLLVVFLFLFFYSFFLIVLLFVFNCFLNVKCHVRAFLSLSLK